MKTVFRVLTYTLISLYATISTMSFFSFGGELKTQLLFVLLLFLLFFFKRPILKMVDLPYEGFLYYLISIVLTVAVINIFAVQFNSFAIFPVTTPNLIIFGFVITSYSLSKLWSGVLAAVIISSLYTYLDWLSGKK